MSKRRNTTREHQDGKDGCVRRWEPCIVGDWQCLNVRDHLLTARNALKGTPSAALGCFANCLDLSCFEIAGLGLQRLVASEEEVHSYQL